jgi:hypothetical protein
MKAFIVLISLFASHLAFADQEWVKNPIVAALAVSDAAESACLTASVLKQDIQAKNQKIFFTAPVMDEEQYKITYCFIDGSGRAKQCSDIAFLTRDPQGWQVVGVDGDAYLMTAGDMGIEAQVTDSTTHQARYVFDARECKSTLIKGVGPLPRF